MEENCNPSQEELKVLKDISSSLSKNFNREVARREIAATVLSGLVSNAKNNPFNIGENQLELVALAVRYANLLLHKLEQ